MVGYVFPAEYESDTKAGKKYLFEACFRQLDWDEYQDQTATVKYSPPPLKKKSYRGSGREKNSCKLKKSQPHHFSNGASLFTIFSLVLFMLYKVILVYFKSVDETPVCDYSNESY